MSYRHEATNREALLYSLGNMASTIFFMFIGSYLMLFYTDVMGITPLAGGAIFMTARLVDAFTDPLMGMIADRTNSRWGRYRPYVLIGAPIFSALFVGIFIVPDLSVLGKIIYSYTVYILFSLARTVVQIAYMSMTALISSDPVRRGRWASYKQVFGVVGGMISMVLGLPLIKAFGGIASSSAWTTTALIYAVLTTVVYLIAMSGTKKIDPPRIITEKTRDRAVVADAVNRKVNPRKQLKYIFGNAPLILLLISFSTDSFANQVGNAIGINFFRYYLERTDLFALTSLIVSLIMLVVGIFMVPPAMKRFGKKKTILFGEIMTIFPLLAVWFLPRTMVVSIVVLTIVGRFFMAFSGIAFWAAVPDCSDYAEWKYGGEAAGAAASSIAFTNKLAQALGAMVSGVILSYTGYVANAASQNAMFLQGMLIAKTWVPIAAFLCSIVAMSFYPLTSEKMKQISADLKQRRSGEAAKENA